MLSWDRQDSLAYMEAPTRWNIEKQPSHTVNNPTDNRIRDTEEEKSEVTATLKLFTEKEESETEVEGDNPTESRRDVEEIQSRITDTKFTHDEDISETKLTGPVDHGRDVEEDKVRVPVTHQETQFTDEEASETQIQLDNLVDHRRNVEEEEFRVLDTLQQTQFPDEEASVTQIKMMLPNDSTKDYMDHHPELPGKLKEFMKCVLEVKPQNVEGFAAAYFHILSTKKAPTFC